MAALVKEPNPPPLPAHIYRGRHAEVCAGSGGFECSPNMSLLLPGFWHVFHGHAQRGLAWMIIVIVTGPLVVPAVIAWILCWLEAVRWEARARDRNG